jgi:serine/threonine-protein kinase HipA
MGGARPKANFLDAAGALWFAKFPSHNDRRDMGGWEYVLNRLAAHAGINVPEVGLRMLSGPYNTFLARRFDRDGNGRRLFASAVTMLGKRDRESASYAEIAEAIDLNGAPGHIEEDLAQLFRRLVFNIVTGHRDDHLRNHGFLRTPAGWRLAPAYDLNPMPDMSQHEVAVGLAAKHPDVKVAVTETAPFCRLTPVAARDIVNEVRSAVAEWRSVAREVGLSRMEVEAVSPAFNE